jgi:hypothetical protein
MPDELAEGALDADGGTFAPQHAISLGRIWNPNLAPASDLQFTATSPNGDAITVVTLLTVDGDYNRDGVVNQFDYDVWRQSLGSTTWLFADGNLDRVVDTADYVTWRNGFGQSALGFAKELSVPEVNADPKANTAPEPTIAPVAMALFGSILVCPSRRTCARP